MISKIKVRKANQEKVGKRPNFMFLHRRKCSNNINPTTAINPIVKMIPENSKIEFNARSGSNNIPPKMDTALMLPR